MLVFAFKFKFSSHPIHLLNAKHDLTPPIYAYPSPFCQREVSHHPSRFSLHPPPTTDHPLPQWTLVYQLTTFVPLRKWGLRHLLQCRYMPVIRDLNHGFVTYRPWHLWCPRFSCVEDVEPFCLVPMNVSIFTFSLALPRRTTIPIEIFRESGVHA
jgi:hypothetical protein